MSMAKKEVKLKTGKKTKEPKITTPGEIYNYKGRLEKALKGLQNADTSERNKELILEFKHDCEAHGIKIARVTKYIYTLKAICERWLSKNLDLDKADMKDIKKIVAEINNNSKFAEWTKHDYKVALKKFYQLLENSPAGKYPPLVDWIKTSIKISDTKIPEDLPSKEDVDKMIAVATNVRDKCMCICLRESAFRISEILKMKLKNVKFCGEYVEFQTPKGKTGGRSIPLVESMAWLVLYIRQHRSGGNIKNYKNPNDYLWIGIGKENKNELLNYEAVARNLRGLKKKAGVKCNVNPHNFRHARATELANVLTESQMCEYFGWRKGSAMPSIYVHLSQRDIKNPILKYNGVETADMKEDKEKSEARKNKNCPTCKQPAPFDSKFCNYCGTSLNVQSALELKDAKDKANKILASVVEDFEGKVVEKSYLEEITKMAYSEAYKKLKEDYFKMREKQLEAIR